MKRRLHEYGLRVLDFEFIQGREILEGLKLNKARRYPFGGVVEGRIYTNQGTLYFKTELGFECDMRSGPKLVDWYVPNLGTLEERITWLVHDLNGYGLDLSFEDTNLLLFAMLRDMAKYKYPKAKLVQLAVSISKSWYGEPKPGDWCTKNVGKMTTKWEPKCLVSF